MNADEKLLGLLERCRRQCETGIISPLESVNFVFHQLAADSEGLFHLAPQVILLLPIAARSEFAGRVQEVLQPEYPFPPWRYEGGRTEKQDQQESELLTRRVRAWAEVFARLLPHGYNA
jgi:hypothetical protein